MSDSPPTGRDVLERNRGLLEQLRVPASHKQAFAELIESSVSRVWAREELSPDKRSLATIAMLAVLVRPDELRNHVSMGLDNGLEPGEICELILQCAVYGGFPAGVRAFEVVTEVFEARGLA